MRYMFLLVLLTVHIYAIENFNTTVITYKINNITVGITNKIIIKLDNNQTINKYLNDFNLTKIKQIGKNLFLVKVSDNNQTLKVSNQLTQMEGVKYAHPDFIKKIIKR